MGSGEECGRAKLIESEIARRIWLKLGRRVEGMQEIIRMRDFFYPSTLTRVRLVGHRCLFSALEMIKRP